MKNFSEKLEERMQKSLMESVCATADHKEPLTIEALQKLAEFAKPLPNLFVVATKHLPDDCYGILYVRPEEMKNWKNER